MPTGFAPGGQMIHARVDIFDVRHKRYLGNKARWCRGTNLVRNYFELGFFFTQTEHGFHKVLAPSAVDPTGTEYPVLAASGADGVVAVQLGFTVHTQGAGGCLLAIGLGTLPRINVVR